MKTDQEKIDVMTAHLRGERIEVIPIDGVRWCFCPKPAWNWEKLNYRIAPKPLKLWVNMFMDGSSLSYATHESAVSSSCVRNQRIAVPMVEVVE